MKPNLRMRSACSNARLWAATFMSFAGLLLLASAALTLSSPQALAQGTLEEIIVTAQKREQSLQDVPIALQAFSSDLMESVNMRDLSEVITMVPGGTENISNTPSQRKYTLRGVVQTGAGLDPTVGYYVNETGYYIFGESSAPISRTFDMERVEVLRGPQSTLYGNSAMGGVVRFITNKPNLENFEAHIQGGFSDTEGGESGNFLDAAVSFPLIQDQLGVRLVASTEDIAGYQIDRNGNKNINPAEVQSYRGELLWHANDVISFDLLYSKNIGDAEGGNLMSSLDPPIGNSEPGDFNNVEQEIISATMNWDLNFAALTANVSALDSTLDSLFQIFIPGLGLPNDLVVVTNVVEGDGLTAELRLASQGDGPLQWLAGVYYADSDAEQAVDANAIIPPFAVDKKSESLSVFAEASYSLMDGKLIPLIGVRWYEDDRSSIDSSQFTPTPEQTFDSISPRFNLQWLPTDNSNYFLNIVQGFRSGSFNNADICGIINSAGFACDPAIDSDEVWSYEVGGKWTLADNQVQLDVSAYYMDWTDNRQAIAPLLGLSADLVAGDAEYKGIDLTVIYAPAAVEGLTLHLAANINDNELVDPSPEVAGQPGGKEGDRIGLTSKYTYSLLASYDRALANNWMGHASMNYSFTSAAAPMFGAPLSGDDRSMLRARIGASFDNGEHQYGVYLFGTNLLNEDGAIFAQNPNMSVNVTQNHPRVVGMEFTYDFN